MAPPPGSQPALALVLGAGGEAGTAFHAGVVAALTEHAGIDPRAADLIVGTSAGANTAASLRGGLSGPDHLARVLGEPMSPEGQTIAARVAAAPNRTAIDDEPVPEADDARGPLSWRMALNAVSSTRGFRPGLALAGGRPAGRGSTAGLAHRADALNPDGWPTNPTWLCAVSVTDGRRVVFGRDDVTAGVGEAVAASSAVPGVYAPVTIGGTQYLDGAVHSPTNADLVTHLALQAVVVSSPMSAQRSAGSWSVLGTVRAWHTRLLDQELNRMPSSVAVLRVEPDAAVLKGIALDPGHPDRGATIARAAQAATRAQLATRAGAAFLEATASAI